MLLNERIAKERQGEMEEEREDKTKKKKGGKGGREFRILWIIIHPCKDLCSLKSELPADHLNSVLRVPSSIKGIVFSFDLLSKSIANVPPFY